MGLRQSQVSLRIVELLQAHTFVWVIIYKCKKYINDKLRFYAKFKRDNCF